MSEDEAVRTLFRYVVIPDELGLVVLSDTSDMLGGGGGVGISVGGDGEESRGGCRGVNAPDELDLGATADEVVAAVAGLFTAVDNLS